MLDRKLSARTKPSATRFRATDTRELLRVGIAPIKIAAGARAMYFQKKILEGLITAAALATFIFTDWSSVITKFKQRLNAEPAPTRISLKHPSAQQQAAFDESRAEISASLYPSIILNWCDVTQTSFVSTKIENYLALQADTLNGRGRIVRVHWIVRLSPKGNRILGIVRNEDSTTFVSQ